MRVFMKKLQLFALMMVLFTALADSCNKEEKLKVEQLQQEMENLQKQSPPGVPSLPEVVQPEDAEFVFTFDKSGYGVDAAGSVSIAYSLPEAASVEVMAMDGWNATVNATGAEEGVIIVTAPDPASPTDIVATATAADGRKTAVTLPIVVRDPYTDATRTSVAAMGYYCFNTPLATDEHFRKMAECGMDMLTIESSDNWLEQLDLAHKYGMKGILFVNGPAGDYYRDRSDTQLTDIIEIAKNHPALAGYQIFDEPHLRSLAQMKFEKARVEELDPNPDHPVYINFGPSNGSEAAYGVREYAEYVETIVTECDLKFITFDQYPVYEGYIDPSWTRTLDIIFNTAKRYNIPFWAFTLCCKEWYREDPTLENIRLQCNVNLAYGAQVNQFFVYRATSGTNFAPLMNDGSYTAAYDYCKSYCREMHNRGFVFAGCNVKQLRSKNGFGTYLYNLSSADLPAKIKGMEIAGEAIVSFVENRGNEYLVVVNGNWQNHCIIDAEFDGIVYSIDHDGLFTEHQSGSKASIDLEGGDMMVFKYR